MKTNVAIELDDEQLSKLADLIDGKPTKRTATRKEINLTVQCCFRAVLTERDLDQSNRVAIAGDDWFDDYLAETCRGAVFGGLS